MSENGNQREMRKIVQALAELQFTHQAFLIQERAKRALINSKLSKDEKLQKARKASAVSRKTKAKAYYDELRPKIEAEIAKHPDIPFEKLDVHLRAMGINPQRGKQWYDRQVNLILNGTSRRKP